MENPVNFNDPAPMDKSSSMWKSLLYTILGTTISILLTFGSGILVQQHRQAQDRKMTALMVMGNIEMFTQTLENISGYLAKCDTLATILLSIPKDSLDAPDYLPIISKTAYAQPAMTLTHDRTTENIFSNSIETWKNMGNFKFINNIGECFSTMNSIEQDYSSYQNRFEEVTGEIIKHPDDFTGKTIQTKALGHPDYRRLLTTLSSYKDYYRYLAAFIRRMNQKNMQLIDISEEEVMQFVEENRETLSEEENGILMDDYRSQPLVIDNIPNPKEWVDNLSK